ncbi:hypothetical protein LCGC14_1093680 [marine sediment metagenome]|uniref:Uncharacterized protein n=1 Tax=marine sediment metagenome TaxID=412755 RepID=A0A0F9MG08_9ZZZZ
MIEISRTDFIAKGKKLYGEDRLAWEFKCWSCENIQSGNSIIKMSKESIKSQRHGLIKKGHQLRPESECYSPTCNWVAYGLIRSDILMINDPSKPHELDTYTNCTNVFDFSKEAS